MAIGPLIFSPLEFAVRNGAIEGHLLV